MLRSNTQGTGAVGPNGEQSAGAPGWMAVMSPCIITSRMVAPCDRCGQPASPVHMPRREHGLYCADCCPVCSKAKDESKPG